MFTCKDYASDSDNLRVKAAFCALGLDQFDVDPILEAKIELQEPRLLDSEDEVEADTTLKVP